MCASRCAINGRDLTVFESDFDLGAADLNDPLALAGFDRIDWCQITGNLGELFCDFWRIDQRGEVEATRRCGCRPYVLIAGGLRNAQSRFAQNAALFDAQPFPSQCPVGRIKVRQMNTSPLGRRYQQGVLQQRIDICRVEAEPDGLEGGHLIVKILLNFNRLKCG